MNTTRATFAFVTAALVGCTVVAPESPPADGENLGSVSSALFTPFSDDFNRSPATWGTFEEIVNGNPCYGDGIASVRQVASPRHGTGKGGSLAVTANAARSLKSNHVIAQKGVPTDSVDVALDYVAWAMIDPSAGDGLHEGQTGPEMSVQRTKLLPEGWRTMTGGVQYIANKWDRQGEWQLWTDDGYGNAAWVSIRVGTVLTKGVWYKIALGIDYAARMYRSLIVTGPDVSFTMDLSARPIVKEVKFSEDALELTLESENAYNNCTPTSPVFEYTVYYDDVSLTTPPAPPPGKTCTGPSTQVCGNCGTQSRTCTKGKWSSWGPCTNEGMCAPLSTQACGNGGTQTCGPTCTWGVCEGEACTPRTCASQGKNCGAISDGCGDVLDCGVCTAPETCGGTGVANVCGVDSCIPVTCQQAGANCGTIANGCGGLLNCGTCSSSQSCGGGGVANQCGGSGGGTCIPKTCQELGANCGAVADGCGGIVQCGSCNPPNICGGGGTPSVCGGGTVSCTPKSCTQLGANCGAISDGCGNIISCGVCVAPQICGSDGVPNVCGDGSTCTARTCADENATCGTVGDGCGNTLDCGACTFPGETCGGSGVVNQCGRPTCTPLTCAQQGVSCGTIGDGCGNTIQCGLCPPGQTCGGGGTPYVCGVP